MQENNMISSLAEIRLESDDNADSISSVFKIDISEISDYFEADSRRYSRSISLD